MRHAVREHRVQMNRGGYSPRLVTMLMMLVIVGLVTYRAADPSK